MKRRRKDQKRGRTQRKQYGKLRGFAGQSPPSIQKACMTSRLSVVLPNYNHADFISRALMALLAQERAADEIIVVDDGSTDDSVSVIQQIATTAPSIRLLCSQANVGVIDALQRGLR